jgi:hypothetical protein
VPTEAGEPCGGLGGGGGGRHDWLVVTGAALDEEPDDEPLEPEPLDELSVDDPPAVVFDAAACAEVATEAAAAEDVGFAAAPCVAVVDVWEVVVLVGRLLAPSAGSCPVARCTKIATQRATKRESVIAATRRRMPRVRCLRAQTRWRARRRPSSGDIGGLGRGMTAGSPPAVRAA